MSRAGDGRLGRAVQELVEGLLRSMTWDEKLAQMQVVFRPDPGELERWIRAGVGAIFWPRNAAAVNRLQRVAVEQTTRSASTGSAGR